MCIILSSINNKRIYMAHHQMMTVITCCSSSPCVGTPTGQYIDVKGRMMMALW